MLFDHLTVDDIDEFGPFARLGGGAYSPLSVAKPRRSYERTALYANLIHNGSRLSGRHCVGKLCQCHASLSKVAEHVL